MTVFFLNNSLLAKPSVKVPEVCEKCRKGFLTVVEFDVSLVFCSNALCNINYVTSLDFLDIRKREVNKK
jgi:hypothetical protein